jgi:outer membrane protein assembly factor BamB
MNLSMFSKFMGMMGTTSLLLLLYPLAWSLDRRRRGERLAGVLTYVGLGVAACLLASRSFQLMPFLLFVLPWVFTAWGVWAIVSRRASLGVRRNGLIAVLALVWGASLLVRSEGLLGEGAAQLRWRWSPTSEERYLASRGNKGAVAATTQSAGAVVAVNGDYTEFRGVARDGVVRGERVGTEWAKTPPKLAWRIAVGPAWSSMLVVGGRVYTQEQQGASEAVVCRDATDGREVWSYVDAARFEETLSGIGPRSTPTFVNGRLYTMGGTGVLNCLDAATGAKRWRADVLKDAKANMPIWGYSSSPLVVDGKVIVFAGGDGANGLVAYDAETGARVWGAAAGKMSYSSAQVSEVNGERVVLFWGENTLIAVEPKEGKVRWSYDTPGTWGTLQPHVIGSDRIILTSDRETTAIAVRRDGERWSTERLWTKGDFHPQFNDFVVHGGNLYGLNGGNVVCVDLGTGKLRWKKGRYGSGQLVLLADQGVLVVASESGEVALVAARPEGFTELGRIEAVTGKTWANPVVAHGRLYVRSAEEMACFELAR